MSKLQHKIYIYSFFIIGIGITLLITLRGYGYYSTELEERFYDSSHNLFKPSGIYGHGLGIIGSVMMLSGVVVYMLRKRLKIMSRWGILKHWLELHIFLCSVGPIMILFHTAFKFGGIVAISFWSMVAVAVSGVIGRFIYILIPRSIEGHAVSLQDLKQQNNQVYNKLKEYPEISDKTLYKIDSYINQKYAKQYSIKETISRVFIDRTNNKKIIKEVRLEIPNKEHITEIEVLLNKRFFLTQRMSLLASLQKIFKYWHIIHLPFALVMIVIMFIHIGIAVAFGYSWIF